MHNEAYIIIGCVKRHMENGFDEINEIAVREWKRERASKRERAMIDREYDATENKTDYSVASLRFK